MLACRLRRVPWPVPTDGRAVWGVCEILHEASGVSVGSSFSRCSSGPSHPASQGALSCSPSSSLTISMFTWCVPLLHSPWVSTTAARTRRRRPAAFGEMPTTWVRRRTF